MKKTYILVWIDEEEQWYYFMEDFDRKQFEDGYVDYYIIVDENGIIVEDSLDREFEGDKFSDRYYESAWEKGKKYVGNTYVSNSNLPRGIAKDVKNEMASYDVCKGEHIKVVNYNIDKKQYKLVNLDLGNDYYAWFLATEKELEKIIS